MSTLPSSPATARNREPLLAVLRDHLPPRGQVLEIAAGLGEHAVFFARAFPELMWQPTDPSDEALAIIAARQAEADLPNLLPPLPLDASLSDPWPAADAIVCINMVHISPWSATEGLMAGAGRTLPTDGVLVLYGPYREAGVPTAPSNEAFDDSLKARNPAWGLRDLDVVTALAAGSGLERVARIEMPANNLSLVFRRI